LARLSGAKVVGAFRNSNQETSVREAGAHQVVIGEDLSPASAYSPYSLILDSVGGSSLATALTSLAPDGVCVFFGTSGQSQVTFDSARFYQNGGASVLKVSLNGATKQFYDL
jgi:NADPH:quinone reductase